jgi:hypothetical protein
MPDTDRPELLGARPIGRSERIPVTRHVDRPGLESARGSPGESSILPMESARGFHMLLSFERPACWPAAQRVSIPGPAGDRANLFADLENCTVANVLGIRVIA